MVELAFPRGTHWPNLYQAGLGMLVCRMAFVPPKIVDYLETAKFIKWLHKPDKQTKKMIVGNRKKQSETRENDVSMTAVISLWMKLYSVGNSHALAFGA